MLNVLHPSSLFLFKLTSFLFKSLRALLAESFELLLMALIDSQFSQFKFSLLIFALERHLLLLSLQFSLILLDERILVFLQLNLPFLVKSVFLLPQDFLLLLLMFTKRLLRLLLKLVLVVLHLLAEHATTILVLHVDLVLQLGQSLLILALFLTLNLKDLAVSLFLELTFFFFKFALKFTLQVVKLNVEL